MLFFSKVKKKLDMKSLFGLYITFEQIVKVKVLYQ